jgi:hypothetical protein
MPVASALSIVVGLVLTAVVLTRKRWGHALWTWLERKFDVPTRKERSKLVYDWDDQQINDQSLIEADPHKDEVNDAVELLKNAPEKGFEALLDLAQLGSIWSMVHVGFCYATGEGVVADLGQSEDWYRRAFEGGSQWALLVYGRRQYAKHDFDKCEAVFSVEAAGDWAPAQYWLACARIKKSRRRATLRQVRPLLESAMEKGSPAAKWILGYYMSWGWLRLRDIPTGIKMVWQFGNEISPILRAKRAAEGGGAKEQYLLGRTYAFGGELAHDDRRAVVLFDLSAAQGNASAMLAKGWMYAHGRGVPYDPLQAYVWTALAATRLPEEDVQSREMATQYRDFYRPRLTKAQAARARRLIKKGVPAEA